MEHGFERVTAIVARNMFCSIHLHHRASIPGPLLTLYPPNPLYSQAGTYAYNPGKGKKERVGRLMEMHANSREDIKLARAGDIVAVAGLKVCFSVGVVCVLCGAQRGPVGVGVWRWRWRCGRRGSRLAPLPPLACTLSASY